MRCPLCHYGSMLLRAKVAEPGGIIRRVRTCPVCGEMIRTVQEPTDCQELNGAVAGTARAMQDGDRYLLDDDHWERVVE